MKSFHQKIKILRKKESGLKLIKVKKRENLDVKENSNDKEDNGLNVLEI